MLSVRFERLEQEILILIDICKNMNVQSGHQDRNKYSDLTSNQMIIFNFSQKFIKFSQT